MANRLKTGMIPPGGWHYPQETSVIRADGYVELVQAVLTWRLQNQRIIGQVEEDIEDYYCREFPNFCYSGNPNINVQVIDMTNRNQLIDRVQQWTIEVYRSPLAKELVSEHEALRRAGVCALCAYNKAWMGGCQQCNNNVERTLVMIRQTKDVGLSNQLQGCSHFGHCNRTAVWMNKELINKVGGEPNNCWMRPQ